MQNRLRIAALHHPVRVLGPGERIGIWVQGCFQNCPFCISPHFQNADGGLLYSVEAFAAKLRLILDNYPCGGLSISGGEPLLQWPLLREVVLCLKKDYLDLDVLVYTGFVYESDTASFFTGNVRIKIPIDWMDTLIDGPFNSDQPVDCPLRGSANQKIFLLTERARKTIPGWLGHILTTPLMQIFQEPSGCFIAGVPDTNIEKATHRRNNASNKSLSSL